MYRKSIVTTETICKIADKKGVPISFNEGDPYTLMFDAGAAQVLRHVAQDKLFSHRFTDSTSIKAEEYHNLVQEKFEAILEKENTQDKELLEELGKLVSIMYSEALEAGFISGFIEGYKFLKVQSPE